MPLNEENDYGEISISENVLKDLVYKSVEGHLKEKKIFDSKIQKELQKSIKVVINDDASVSLSLKVPAKYGENIVSFTKEIQKIIKEELEKIAEVYVSNVDVTIDTLLKPEEIEEYEEVQEGENEEKEKAEEKDDDDEEEEEEEKKD
ncbi:Asp23/Gls24 family envelope stress response protein [Petrotoga sp. 9PWA.NaAc.5.4]|uniref:Asp23/Gls24 family envelope stress response protein n=1 Tax=Petrotoga sp. 9PWA.NaAc.5.4 TaxID=1434328 RepID=UPI000CB80CAA|nr:Asp23/Gls24 family envelope stress response protein [Petrotoga sp. 9PWA.NaAc.5.4]PNR93711.1 hypothetical protein X924_07790 [Petrotoga sp. 9PWA.NaAc.5.4]